MTERTLYFNGVIYANPRSKVEALLTADGRVVGAGPLADLSPEDAVRVDLRGATLLPGLIDAHYHFSMGALLRLSIACGAARRVADIQGLVRAAANDRPAGDWILGGEFDERTLREGRFPTREELDVAAPEHPVAIVHYSLSPRVL